MKCHQKSVDFLETIPKILMLQITSILETHFTEKHDNSIVISRFIAES